MSVTHKIGDLKNLRARIFAKQFYLDIRMCNLLVKGLETVIGVRSHFEEAFQFCVYEKGMICNNNFLKCHILQTAGF